MCAFFFTCGSACCFWGGGVLILGSGVMAIVLRGLSIHFAENF